MDYVIGAIGLFSHSPARPMLLRNAGNRSQTGRSWSGGPAVGPTKGAHRGNPGGGWTEGAAEGPGRRR